MFPLLEQTEKTLAYIQQKCDNAEPSSNNSATSRNVSGKTDKLRTLMHGHSKIQQNSELLDNPNSQQGSNINRN